MSSNSIEMDFSAAELFLSYIDNKANIDEVWDHEAYNIIRKHAEKLRGGLVKHFSCFIEPTGRLQRIPPPSGGGSMSRSEV